MNKIKYDMNLMKYISLFSTLTKANVKDVIEEDDHLLFVVGENHIAKAIGKNGSNVKRISHMLKKKIKVVEFNPDVIQFVKNLMYPLRPVDITQEDDTITITGKDTKEKGILIGRNSANLKKLEEVVSRYFDIKEIKVV